MATKKRLLILISRFPVTTETFIQREIVELAAQPEFAVTVFSMERGNGEIDKSLTDKIIYKRATVADILLSPIKFSAKVLSNYKDIIRVWKILGNSDLNLLKKLILLLKSVGVYADVIAKNRPDFIYAHFLSEPSSVGLCVAHYLKIPFGISAHAEDVLVTAQMIREKAAFSAFINICNLKAYDYCLSKTNPGDKEKINLRYHGVPLPESSTDRTPLKTEGDVIILNNSRMSEKKGQIYLLEAVRLLKSEGLNIKLKIISGKGELYPKLRSYCQDNNLLDSVEFVNDGQPIPYSEVEHYYTTSDIFVFPSIETKSGDADGVANVLVEAALHSLPIVATDAGSAGEIITDHLTGYVVKQRDVASLVSAIKEILNNPEDAFRFAKNACELAKDKFNIKRNIAIIKSDILANCL